MKKLFIFSALLFSAVAFAADPIPSAETVVPPAVNGATSPNEEPSQKDLLKKQLAREEEREQAAASVLEREQVSHEAGRSSATFSYVQDPFANMDYDPSDLVKQETSFGANINYIYYFARGTAGYGRIGLGPNLGVYWTNLADGKKHSYDTIGAVATYEAQLWISQLIVPHVSIGYDQIIQRAHTARTAQNITVNSPSARYASLYYAFGAALNLNRLEQKVAAKALADTGVKKFYLAYSFQHRSNSNPRREGDAHLLGLRLEY